MNLFFKYSPLFSFIMVWIIVFTLSSLSLYNLKSVDPLTLKILLVSIFSLISGYVLSQIYSPDTRSDQIGSTVQIVNVKLLIKLVLFFSSLQILGSFIIFKEVANGIGGYSVYFSRPILVRQYIVGIQNGYEAVTPLYRIGNYISNSGFLSIIFGGVLFASKSKYRVFGLIAIISLIITQLVSVGRYRFISGLVFYIVSYLYYCYFFKGEIRKKRIVGLFYLISFSTLSITILSYYVLKFRSPLELDIIGLVKKSIYYYLTGGVVAFDNFLKSDFQFLYGESSFRSIYKWLARIGLWSEADVLTVHNPFTKIAPNYSMNTFTFAKSIYQDFGIMGSIFIPFFWGIITYKTVKQVLYNFSFLSLFWLCLFTFSLIITFFSFYFQSITLIIYWFLNMYLVHRYFSKRIFQVEQIEL